MNERCRPPPKSLANNSQATFHRHTISNPNYPTAYFRREFTLTTPFDTVQPRLEFQRDDGCILYLNGVEIYRDSTPYTTGGPLPFVLGGWTVIAGAAPYEGSLTREGTTIKANQLGTASTRITRDN